jgi:hypothetical protein
MQFNSQVAITLNNNQDEARPGRHVGFVVDKVALGQVSSEYFGFPCQIHSTICSKNHLHHHNHQSIIGDMYNRPNGQTSMAAVQGPNRHLGT